MTHENPEGLNRWLDDLSHGATPTDDDLDSDLLATVRWFHDLGAEPLPDQALRTRLEHRIMNQLAFAPSAGLPAGAPDAAPPGLERGRRSSPVSLSERLPRWRWASVRLVAALVLVAAGLVYLVLGPLRDDPNGPRSIPAAVGPNATPGTSEATPTATPYPMTGHPFIGAWNWTRSDGADPGCCGVGVADVDGTYLIYNSHPGVGIGTWRATGKRTVEIRFTFQQVVPRDAFDPTQLTAGTTFLPMMEVWTISVTIDETGHTARLVGGYRVLDSNGKPGFSTDSIDWVGTRMVPDPAAVTPAPTA